MPVLSVQMTVVDPKVSTDPSLLTTALRFANSRAPRARVTVTMVGNPSGTADTARATAVMSTSSSTFPILARSRSSIVTTTMATMNPSFLANWSSLRLSGISSFSTTCTISAILPNCVFMPVDMTMAFPLP